MAREIALSFALGARLQSGFTAAFQSASSQAKAVSQAIRDMERTPVGKIGAAMSTQQEKIRGLSGSLKDARGELDGLWQRASQAGTMTTVMARQIEQAEARVRRLSGALSRQTATYRETVAQAASTSGSVRALTRDYAQLSAQLERARAVQTAMAANRSQAGALQAQRADLQGRLLGTAAVGASVALPVKLAISAEDTFADLRKVMDAPESVMQQVFSDAQEMSNRTGKSFEDVVTIMTAAAQAGLGTTREQLLGVADQAVKMSIAWGVSAEQAGKSLATWQAAMGLTSEQSMHTADVINALSNAMNAEAGAIDKVFTEVGPLMKSTGLATQDIAALATAFEAAGAAPDKAATAMKNFVKVIAAGPAALTDERKSIYKYLQLDPAELQKQMQTDAKGAVMRVLEALQRVRPEERNSISTLLFGDDSLMAIMPLLTQIDTLRKAFDIANSDVSGSVLQEYENRMKTTATAISQLTQSTRNLGATVGATMLPVVGAVARGLTVVTNGARETASRFPRLTAVVMTAVAAVAAFAVGAVALGLVFNVLRTTTNSWRGLLLRLVASQVAATASTTGLTASSLAFGAASKAAGMGARILAGGLRSLLVASGAGIALVGLGFAANWVMDNWDRLRIFFAALLDNLAAVAQPALDRVIGAFNRAYDSVLSVWGTVSTVFSVIWQGVTESALTAWSYVTELGAWAYNGIAGIWSGAAAFFASIVDGITGIFAGFFNWLSENFQWIFSVIETVGDAVGAVTGAVSDAWSKAFGDGDKKAADNAAKTAEKAATSSAAKTAAQDSAAKVADPPKYQQRQSFNDFMAAEEAAKKKGKKGSGSRAAGGTTVVTLAGDNSRPQSLFFPAGSRTGVPLPTTAGRSTLLSRTVAVAAPVQAAGRVGKPTALPQTPARLARRGGTTAQASGSNGQIMVDLTQNFSLMSSDPRAVRRVLESIKPDMEALIRRALDKIASDRRRTAYA